jgi:hypothetical protein
VSGVQISQPSGSPWLPTGAILENFPRFQGAQAAQSALTSGTIRTFPLGILRKGHTATGLGFTAAIAAAGITYSWAGISTIDRVIRAISSNSTAATNANAARIFPFDTAYTPTDDTFLVGFVMYVATTVPTMYGITPTIQLSPIVGGNSNTAQTTPLTVGSTLAPLTTVAHIAYLFLTG